MASLAEYERAENAINLLLSRFKQNISNIDKLGKQPYKPSSESRFFGKGGRAKASPASKKYYDDSKKIYNAWNRRKLKLDKENAILSNQIFYLIKSFPPDVAEYYKEQIFDQLDKKKVADYEKRTMRKRNKTIIKADRIEHVDVAKVHNPRTRRNAAGKADILQQGVKAGLLPAGLVTDLKRLEEGRFPADPARRANLLQRALKHRNDLIYQNLVQENLLGEAVQRALYEVIAREQRRRSRRNPVVPNPRKRETRNPSVRETFETFNGRPATKTTTVQAPRRTPARVAQLGRLRLIRTADGRTWRFPGERAPYLAADSRGKLHVVGGQYRANPAGEDCGEIEQIEYQTSKPHLGHDNQTIYYHQLGEETGERPILEITPEGELKIVGGDYRIEADGIHN